MESVAETWTDVKGLEGMYEVSDAGRVRSLVKKPARILKGGITKNGYHLVQVAGQYRYVHRLVLEAFVSPCPPRHEACHANGIKNDNRLLNLRWDTRPANNSDRVLHGTSNRGERCGTSKLTEKQVIEILASTERTCDLAKRFGVRHTAISRIRNGHRWGHLRIESLESK